MPRAGGVEVEGVADHGKTQQDIIPSEGMLDHLRADVEA